QHVSRDAVVHVVGLGVAHHVLEGRAHDVLQLLVYHRLLPEVALPVLDPLEVAGGHAPGIGQNVGNNKDALLRQDLVGGSGSRTVGAFAENAALDLSGVAAGDHVLGGRGHQDVAFRNQQLLRIVRLGPGEAGDGTFAQAVLPQRVNINSILVVQPAVHLGDADNLVTVLVHEPRGIPAHVAKALNNHARLLAIHVQPLQRLVAYDHHPAAGGLAPPARSPNVDGLAGHHRGDRLPHVHRVGVHDPGHDLLVGIHVGRGNVLFRAD